MSAEHTSTSLYDKKNPFPAKVLVNRILNKAGSDKDTRHIEISLKGSGLTYECGDSLGVYPVNCPDLVGKIIQALGATGNEEVKGNDGNPVSFKTALEKHYVINKLTPALLKAAVAKVPDLSVAELLKPENKPKLDEYLWGRDPLDVLTEFPQVKFTAQEFAACLGKLQPRLYSIASSLKAHPEEVHLTVAAVRYESHGRKRKGVCSTYLADLTGNGAPVPVFVAVSHGFRPPVDPNALMIMVGPGTGIAPFRAFLEERKIAGAKGKNWLFFGDQHAATDFLYEEEFAAMKADGVLTRLDTAFSRDQAEKIYVQNRMLENGAELWSWLQQGAYFYVCGDAKRMAKDVDAALHQIAEKHGNLSTEQAIEYIKQLKADKRYLRDVY